jgi:DNA-binding CsgD family transcriptional regulator
MATTTQWRHDVEHLLDELVNTSGERLAEEAQGGRLNDSGEAIVVHDRSGRILASTDRFRELFGESCSDSNASAPGAENPAGRELGQRINELIQLGMVGRMEFTHYVNVPKFGTVKAVTVKSPLLDKRGNVAGIVDIWRVLEPTQQAIPGMSEEEARDRVKVLQRMPESERRVLRLVCEGHSNREIATLVEAPVRTVENRRRRLMNRLGVDSLADLVKCAIRLQDAQLIDLGI